jgi:predicted DCC family thiol-disulfide oxidoreductase YuxK
VKTKKNENLVLLFDGVCNLCNGLVQFVIKRDRAGRFRFGALQSKSGRTYLKKLKLPVQELETLVLVKDGNALTKSSGALTLLRELGGFWSWFYVFMIIPVPVRDWVYDLIARNRYSIFGRTQACMIPTPELKKRFLSGDSSPFSHIHHG